MNSNIGYTKHLYILPFDHRNTFAKSMYHVQELSLEQQAEVTNFKLLIYKAFKWALSNGVSKEDAAILVDDELGMPVLEEAKKDNIIVLYTLEKSGTNALEMVHDDWRERVLSYKPAFCKMLVRYNPDDPISEREAKLLVLKSVSEFVHTNNFKFLLEPLIPATQSQLQLVNGDQDKYDSLVRPDLTVKMIAEMQEKGIEIDVWKLEGMEQKQDYEKVIIQAKSMGRDNVGVVVLGRGAGVEKVNEWLRIGASVQGVIGFAVGRTVFWESLEKVRAKTISEEQAVEEIGKNFLSFYNIFTRK